MPQKLTINDYMFYLVPDENGKYLFGTDDPVRGNVHRKPKKEFEQWAKVLTEVGSNLVMLYGIGNVTEVETGDVIEVYEIFADLKEQMQ